MPVVEFHASNNTGSSSGLLEYLDKEVKDNWRDYDGNILETQEVQKRIDQLSKEARKDRDKFSHWTVNPSEKETKAIIEKATGRKDIDNEKQLSKEEKEKVEVEFSKYVSTLYDKQIDVAKREGLTNGKQINAYAKIEWERKYKGLDEDVKNGKAKSGELKKGLNLHAHVIQSRKFEAFRSNGKRRDFSPESKNKGQSASNKIKQGFHRNEFKSQAEKAFDKQFNHQREIKEKVEYLQAKKANDLKKVEELEKKQKVRKVRNEPNRSFGELGERYMQRKNKIRKQKETEINKTALKIAEAKQRKIEEQKENKGYSR